MNSPRSEFVAGVKAEAPLILGAIPFGMIYGVLALGAGLPLSVAQAMSLIVFAGSAQFIGVRLISEGVLGVVILVTTFIVNLRHALYSASVAPYVRYLSRRWKWLLAYLLTDEAYAIAILHYEPQDIHQPSNKRWYHLGAGLTDWTSWQLSTALGIFLGAQVPASWGLDFTLALTFIAIVVPALKDRPSVAAALSAGVVAVLTGDLPYRLGLILAAFVGILVGLVAEAYKPLRVSERVETEHT